MLLLLICYIFVRWLACLLAFSCLCVGALLSHYPVSLFWLVALAFTLSLSLYSYYYYYYYK